LNELRCTHCAAPVPPHLLGGGAPFISCPYCGTTLRVPSSGRVLAATDFRDPAMPGWTTGLKKELELAGGELLTRLDAHPGSWNVLRSLATFDDFDVSVTLRLLWGDLTSTNAGLMVRRTDRGWYQVGVSTNATVAIDYFNPQHQPLMPWTHHPCVRGQPGDANELRIVMIGDRLRVFVNGVQIAALRDPSSSFGQIYLFGSSRVPMAVAFSSLVVREPDQASPDEAPAMEGGYDVVLLAVRNKIMAIKVVREATGLGLKESKDLVEEPRPTLLRGVPRERGEQMVNELRACGNDAELITAGRASPRR
jgi:ribosomal protein L7/L12